MEMTVASNDKINVVLSDDSCSDGDEGVNDAVGSLQLSNIAKDITPEGLLMRRAEMYQDYMKQLPMPTHRGSVIPFTSWVGLGKSVKQLYGQPLHYLTNILLKQWDRQRIGSDDEHVPLDIMVHPSKAEATIWLIEEVHRRTSSHYEIAKLWLSDPMHHADVDPIFPQL